MVDVRDVPPNVARAAPGPEFAEVSNGSEFSKTEDDLNMRFPEWVALFKNYQTVDRAVDSADASQDGMAKPPAATDSEFVDDDSITATNIPRRHDDEPFPFPPNIRHRHGKSDGGPPPPWWRIFGR